MKLHSLKTASLALVTMAATLRAASLTASVNGGVLQDPLNFHLEFGFTTTLPELEFEHTGLFPDRPSPFGTVGRWEQVAHAQPGSLGVGVAAAAQNVSVPAPIPVEVLVGTELLPPHNLPLSAGAYARFESTAMLVRATDPFGLPAVGGFGLHFALDGTVLEDLLLPGALHAGGALAEAGLFVELGMTYLNSSLVPVTQTAYGAVTVQTTGGGLSWDYPLLTDLGLEGPNLLGGYAGGARNLLLAGTDLAVGQPFTVWAVLEANARAVVTAEAFANVGIGLDFTHTLSFPTAGPVADLPAGYTLDGPDVFVNDNSFGAVPEAEPWAAGLAVAGLCAAVWRRRVSSLHRGGVKLRPG